MKYLPFYLFTIGGAAIMISMVSIVLPVFGVLTISQSVNAMLVIGVTGIIFLAASLIADHFSEEK